ncbi:MAG TPA: gluconate transporter [Cytophagales bacterium]|nr:gluconate transporter [Cytophagales bacterium]
MALSLLSILVGIAVLLLLILVFKIHAFLALLISSITVGLLSGLDPTAVLQSVTQGMGGTLGFVATIIGLGAILGGILENAGGVQVISQAILKRFGEKRAPTAMLLSGFIISIPVFFDVAFIILVPVLYALQRKTGKSLLAFAIPLLAGLAVTHAFIPPTPGPVAVADILKVNLGSVIIMGLLVGIPTAICCGLLFGRYIARRIHIPAPPKEGEEMADDRFPPFGLVLAIILIPIVLILANTTLSSGLIRLSEGSVGYFLITLLGHPISALILATILAWILLGRRQGFSSEALQKISVDALKPAGTIILLTGAGGVFKQILVDTNAGVQVAEFFTDLGIPLLPFAFLAAVLIRLIQGSATVAMITAAGLVAPLLQGQSLTGMEGAAFVIAIASGASIFSHVNDSGFWLVKQYLGLEEMQTFQSWSLMTLTLSISGAIFVFLWSLVL